MGKAKTNPLSISSSPRTPRTGPRLRRPGSESETSSRTQALVSVATLTRLQPTRQSHIEQTSPSVRRYNAEESTLKVTWQHATVLQLRDNDHQGSPSRGRRGFSQSVSVTQVEQGELTATVLVNHNARGSGHVPRALDDPQEINPLNYSSDHDSINSIKTKVDNINYLIDNTISNIIEQFKTRIKRFTSLDLKKLKDTPRHMNSSSPTLIDIYSLLSRDCDPNHSPCDLLLDVLMHDILCKNLSEKVFQDIPCFSGIDPRFSEDLKGVYDTICQEESWVLARRWHCFTSKHAYLGKKCAEKEKRKLSELSEGIMGDFHRLLIQVYPFKKNNFKTMIKEVIEKEEKNINVIVSQAFHLALKIEHNIASCRMEVVTCPLATHSRPSASAYNPHRKFDPLTTTAAFADNANPQSGDAVLGTFQLGLQQVIDKEVKPIILPMVITSSFVSWCKKMINKHRKLD